MKSLVALLCLSTMTSVAWAAPRDYRLDSSAWNGLSRLRDEADLLGCRVSESDELDWSRLGPRDVLFIIYPQSPVDPQAMAEYLERGGRLLLADDFGTAEQAFAALELRRTPARLEGVARMPKHPELPVAHARLLTDLGRSVGELVANKPAAFDTALPATFAFSPGQALVVEGQVGSGRFVALADPSVLINNMLEVESNRLFVHALLVGLCHPGTDGDRVHVVTGAFQSRASLHLSSSGAGALPRLNEVFGTLNREADQLAPMLALPLSVLFCLAAAFVSWAGLQRKRLDRHSDGSFTRAARVTPLSPQALVAAMPADADHAVPLILLRADVLRTLSTALGPIPSGSGDQKRRPLVDKVRARFGDEAAREAERLFALLPAELESQPRGVTAATFARALELARPLLARAAESEEKSGDDAER